MGELYVVKRYQLATGARMEPWKGDTPGSLTKNTRLAWGCWPCRSVDKRSSTPMMILHKLKEHACA